MVYAAIALPAVAGIYGRRWRGAAPVVAAMLGCSLAFFAASNFAVWAFSGMYPMTWQGLTECYVAALPFLDRTVLGDLFWCAVLFGGAWFVQHGPVVGSPRALKSSKSPTRRMAGISRPFLVLRSFSFAHDLLRKPVPIPDQVGDRLFRDRALPQQLLHPRPD